MRHVPRADFSPLEEFTPAVGEIRAVRTFRIGGDGTLYPLFVETPWRDGTNHARCRVRTGGEAHAAPEPSCTCGFYAYADPRDAAEYPQSRHVLAVVACWGRIVAGTRGIRAECARIEAIWTSAAVPPELAAAVAARYPSVAVLDDRAGLLVAHPVTVLDCYAAPAGGGALTRAGVRSAGVCGLALGVLPLAVLLRSPALTAAWIAAIVLFLLTAAALRLTRIDRRAKAGVLYCLAMVLWLAAPLAGAAGMVLFHLPMLQIGALVLARRVQLNRSARRFPSEIAATPR